MRSAEPRSPEIVLPGRERLPQGMRAQSTYHVVSAADDELLWLDIPKE